MLAKKPQTSCPNKTPFLCLPEWVTRCSCDKLMSSVFFCVFPALMLDPRFSASCAGSLDLVIRKQMLESQPQEEISWFKTGIKRLFSKTISAICTDFPWCPVWSNPPRPHSKFIHNFIRYILASLIKNEYQQQERRTWLMTESITRKKFQAWIILLLF